MEEEGKRLYEVGNQDNCFETVSSKRGGGGEL